jgi:hypothetical protein
MISSNENKPIDMQKGEHFKKLNFIPEQLIILK